MVLIKGGPSARSWVENTGPDEFKDYNLIVIELPGAGLNKFDKKEDANIAFDKEVNVEAAAALVKDVIAQETKNGNIGEYVIGGHSYGTAVATAAAAAVSADKAAVKPKGVLLMGTQGRATKQQPGGHEVTEGAKAVSNQAFCALTSEEKTKFKALVDYTANLPAGNPGMDPLNKISGGLLGPLSGDFDAGLKNLKDILALAPDKAYAKLTAGRGGAGAGAAPKPDPAQLASQEYAQKFYASAGCEMVSGAEPMDTSKFFGDQLVSVRPNACYCSTSDHVGKYKSANYQIKNLPLFYVSADDDFNTPSFQFKNHFEGQTSTGQKTVFKAPTGGHGLGFGQFAEGKCGGAVGAIFDSSPSGFWKGMSSCTGITPQISEIPVDPIKATQ